MTENKSGVKMKLIKDYLEYIDYTLNGFHKIIQDKCDLDAFLFLVNRKLAEVDTKISLTFHDEGKGEHINEYGLTYLIKFDQGLRRGRKDMQGQGKILNEPLDAFKHYVTEELELQEDGVF